MVIKSEQHILLIFFYRFRLLSHQKNMYEKTGSAKRNVRHENGRNSLNNNRSVFLKNGGNDEAEVRL